MPKRPPSLSPSPSGRIGQAAPGEGGAAFNLYCQWAEHGGGPLEILFGNHPQIKDIRLLSREYDWNGRLARQKASEVHDLKQRHRSISRRLAESISGPIVEAIEARLGADFLSDCTDKELLEVAIKGAAAVAALSKLERLSNDVSETIQDIQIQPKESVQSVLESIWAKSKVEEEGNE